MPLRPRRSACLVLAGAMLASALAACGSDNSAASTASDSTSPLGSSASSGAADSSASATPGTTGGVTEGAAPTQVSFTGDVGKALTPAWTGAVPAVTSTSVSTLVQGTGDAIASGDVVQTYVWIGDGTTQKTAYSDFDKGKAESLPTTGELGDVFTQIFAGATYGTRRVAVTTPEALFGSATGNPSLGIAATDTVVVVADLVSKAPPAATSPTPTDNKAHTVAPSKLPAVIVKGGKPVGLDFTGIAKPKLTTPVQRAILQQGKGAVVKASDTLTVNYLGAVYRAKTPFDESYSKQPFTSPLSGLIPGWATGLTGLRVGTRVLLQIPPAAGYGAQGSGSTIPPNATLWFVIDIVKAS